MIKRFPLLHGINFAIRFLATVWMFLYLTVNDIMTFVPAFLVCSGVLLVAFLIWRGYIYMDHILDASLRQVIVTMPLFDLIEILNNRDDIKRLVINELEETET